MKRLKLVIVLALAAIVLASCSSYHRQHGYRGEERLDRAKQEVSALVDNTVQDQSKAAEVKAVMAQIVSEATQSRQQNREFHQQLYALNASYDAPPEDFLKILDNMNAQRMQAASRILRLRFDMKELMTQEEWKTFSDGLAEMRNRYRAPERKKEE